VNPINIFTKTHLLPGRLDGDYLSWNTYGVFFCRLGVMMKAG